MMLHGLTNDAPQPPPFLFTQGSTFFNLHDVTDIAAIFRIISEIFHALLDIFPIELMPDFPFYADNDAFLHSVTDNSACPGLL